MSSKQNVHVISFKVNDSIFKLLEKAGAEIGLSAHLYARTIIYKGVKGKSK